VRLALPFKLWDELKFFSLTGARWARWWALVVQARRFGGACWGFDVLTRELDGVVLVLVGQVDDLTLLAMVVHILEGSVGDVVVVVHLVEVHVLIVGVVSLIGERHG